MTLDGRTIDLHPSAGPGAPLVVLLTGAEEDAAALCGAARASSAGDFSLALVGGFDWNDDLTPWPAPPLSKGQPGFGGRADAFLEWLTGRALPEIFRALGSSPAYAALAGYSLAGLFAIYALYRTDAFARAASASGSLWYPGFMEYVQSHKMPRKPGAVYLSVGERERRTRIAVMKPVEDNTRRLSQHLEALDIPVVLEINPGGHFDDPEGRMGRGIGKMLEL